jgi:hypothetical protein
LKDSLHYGSRSSSCLAPAFVSFIRLTFVKNQKVIYIEKSLVGGCSMLVRIFSILKKSAGI